MDPASLRAHKRLFFAKHLYSPPSLCLLNHCMGMGVNMEKKSVALIEWLDN